ncbi:NB-ARC domain-containing protein [Streptomyces sp. NPDC002623]
MEAELAALAASGATTLVALMVSESWAQARERLAGFFARRRRAGQGVEAGLEESGEELGRARRAGDEETVAGIEADWRSRLLELLQAEPDAAAELRGLLAELAPMVQHTVISGGVNHGPAFQGSHISGPITFNVQPPLPRTPGARPDQVPALTVQFSNRVAELATLDDVCGARTAGRGGPQVAVGVLGGLPGVGKSATAWQWAHKQQDLFPDGQLYVDYAGLRGPSAAGGGGADVSEALAMLLRGLQVREEFIPPSLAERTALYRSHSAGRRLLVVLDDVSHPAQVRPLIPKGRGSAVLVTSQSRLGELVLDGARLVPLGPLETEGALALLSDRCGQEAVAGDRAAAERLTELCGGLPVALQIVAARLLTDGHLTMASLATELADEAARLAGMALPGAAPADGHQTEEYSVSAVLGSTYRLLPPDAARLYRLLGLLPMATFDAAAAAAAARLDSRQTCRLLGALISASLLEATSEGRYRMHDLVRLHARERAADEEPCHEERALLQRVATHYLVLTAFADRALRADRLRIADLSELLRGTDTPFVTVGGPPPLEWLEAERPAILGVLRASARHGLHTLTWQLAEAFTVLFLHRRHLAAWKESLELGAEAAADAAATAHTAQEIAQATQAEARLRSLLSRPLTDLGRHDRAGEELQRAVARAEVTDHLVLRASVQEFLGRHLERADLPGAVTAYRLSLDLNTRAGNARGAALAAYFLGCAQDAQQHHGQALVTLQRAHQSFRDLPEPDRRMAARAMAAIGVAHDHLGHTAEAVRALREAAQTLHETGATHYEAQALMTLAGIAQRHPQRPDDARAWLSRALAIHEADGSPLADAVRQQLQQLGP